MIIEKKIIDECIDLDHLIYFDLDFVYRQGNIIYINFLIIDKENNPIIELETSFIRGCTSLKEIREEVIRRLCLMDASYIRNSLLYSADLYHWLDKKDRQILNEIDVLDRISVLFISYIYKYAIYEMNEVIQKLDFYSLQTIEQYYGCLEESYKNEYKNISVYLKLLLDAIN